MEDNRAIAAIASVVFLTALALWLGYDGVLFMTAIAVISGLGGYILFKESPPIFRSLADAIELLNRERERK